MEFDHKDIKHFLKEDLSLCESCTPEDLNKAFRAAEKIVKEMLGATLEINGNKFILRALELYYGSAGDCAHDWLRKQRVRNKDSKQRVSIQYKKGPLVYLSSDSLSSNYSRMDIVIGSEGVAISVLIRDAWILDSTVQKIQVGKKKDGNPNLFFKRCMSIEPRLKNGDSVCIEQSDSPVKLYKNQNTEECKTSKRIGPYSVNCFENYHGLKWHFSLFLK